MGHTGRLGMMRNAYEIFTSKNLKKQLGRLKK